MPLHIEYIVTDTRLLKPNSLYVALKGPNFDGNKFALQALTNGAEAVIIDKLYGTNLISDPRVILVDDCLNALAKLAAYARQRTKAKIIAITGSFGKTSIKDALYHVLKQEFYTLANAASFNNHLGVPITLANLHPDHEYAIIEIGMNNLGEIAKLSKLVKPHIAIITNIGEAHIGKLHSIANIANAKAEIFTGMQANAIAIFNSQEKFTDIVQSAALAKKLKIINFHNNPYFKISEQGIQIWPYFNNIKLTNSVHLNTFAQHWATNISAITAVLNCLDFDLVKACKYLSNFVLQSGRGRILHCNNITILDESYNAGISSTKNAIVALRIMQQEQNNNSRTIAILGDMLELGDKSIQYHQEFKDILIAHNINKVHCFGHYMRYLYDILPTSMKGCWQLKPANDTINLIIKDIQAKDIYLVKGSRGQWASSGIMSVFVQALQQKELN